MRKQISKKTKIIGVAGLVGMIGVFCFTFFSQAAVNEQLNYQGKLTNTSDVAVADGNYDMVFKIYDGSNTLLWTGTYTAANGNAVAVSRGIFSVMLGSGTGNAMSLNFEQDTYYLGVTVGTDAEMSPRKRLGAVPQAINSLNVVGSGYIDIDNTGAATDAANINYNPASGSNSALSVVYGSGGGTGTALKVAQAGTGYAATFMGGNVGIGTTSPGEKLQIYNGNVRLETAYAVKWGNTAVQLGRGIDGQGGNDLVLTYWDNLRVFDTQNDLVRMSINSSGNVGIGTTSPNANFEVANGKTFLGTKTLTANNQGDVVLFSNAAGTAAQSGSYNNVLKLFGGSSQTRYLSLAQVISGDAVIQNALAGDLQINSVSDVVLQATSGNVGIGTTSPQSLLHVAGSGDAAVSIESTAATEWRLFTDSTGTFKIRNQDSALNSIVIENNASSNSLYLKSGNVGIGTTGPGYKLDIYGGNSTAGDILLGNWDGNSNYNALNLNGLTGMTNYNFLTSKTYSNLYINRPTGSNISFREGGSIADQMTILSGGNVGIGTTAPGAIFHVLGSGTSGVPTLSTSFMGVFQRSGSASYGSSVGIIGGNTGTSNLYFGDTDSATTGGLEYDHSINLLSFRVSGGVKMAITSAGNVGIGTTSPNTKLHVSGGSLFVQDTGATEPTISYGGVWTGYNSSSGIGYIKSKNFGGSAWRQLYLEGSTIALNGESSGNVGIGTTNPSSAKLEVAGQVKITGGSPGASKILTSDADGLASWTALSGIGVTSITGTAYQITASASTGAVTLSIPSDFRAPGTVNAVTGIYTGAGAGTLRLNASGALSNITTLGMSNQLTSTLATGTSPFAVTSTTVNTNLNADYLDGYHYNNLPYLGSASGTDNYIPRFSGANAIENSVMFDNGTSIGIGTTSPGARLHILGASGNNSLLRIANNDYVSGSVGSGMYFQTGAASGDIYSLIQAFDAGANSVNDLILQQYGGNVGIGTTSPVKKLHVAGDSYLAGDIYMLDTKKFYLWPDTSGPYVAPGAAAGLTIASGGSNQNITIDPSGTGYTIIASGNVGIGTTSPATILQIGNSAVGSGVYSTMLSIGVEGARHGIMGKNDSPTDHGLAFYTSVGGGAAPAERMRINENGLGIGTTLPSFKLDFGAQGSYIGWGSSYAWGMVSNKVVFDRGSAFPSGYDLNVGASSGLFINSSGNVGIGTTSPHSQLEIFGSYPELVLNRNGVWGSRSAGIKFSTDGPVSDYWTFGMQPDSTNNMYLKKNSTTYLTILDANGNVGIGTTNPQAKLDVLATSGSLAIQKLQSNSAASGGYTIYTDAANSASRGIIGHGNSVWTGGAITDFGITSYGALLLGANNAEKVRITTGGNVGIGTTAPLGKLHIEGFAGTGQLELSGTTVNHNFYENDQGADGKYWGWRVASGLFTGRVVNDAYDSAVNWLQVSRSGMTVNSVTFPNGNVGIGTTDPSQKLHVASGNIALDSTYQLILAAGDSGASYLKYNPSDTIRTTLFGYYGVNLVSNSGNLALTNAGNVGIGTTAPVAKLEVAGAMSINYPIYGKGNTSAKTFYNLAQNSYESGQTGYFVIQTNIPQDEHTMVQINVDVFGVYSDGSKNNCQLVISGYWSTEANGGFQGLGYTSTCGDKMTVQVARNTSTGKTAIILGAVGTSWSYPRISVPKAMLSYAISDSYADGWSISVTTDISGYSNNDTVPDKTYITKTAILNSGTLPFSWADSEVSDAITVTGGTIGSNTISSGSTWTTAGTLTIGDNGDNVLVSAANWDVDASGNIFANGGISTYDTTVTDNYIEAGGICLGNGTNCITSWTNVGGSVNGSGTANYIPRWSDTDTLTNSIIYDNGTNVGIGTTSPGAKLEVNSGSTAVGSNGLYVYNSPSAGYSTLKVSNNWYDGNGGNLLTVNNANPTNPIKFVIDNSGNVGIGTTAPTTALHINGANTAARGQLSIVSTGTSARQTFYAGSTFIGHIEADTTNGMTFSAESTYPIRFVPDGNNERVRITSTGYVGIGTTNPGGLLQVGVAGSATGAIRAYSSYVSIDAAYQSAGVYGTAALPALIFGGDDDTGIWHPASNNLAFSTSGSEVMRITGGNVGIGTTNPLARLQVGGSVSGVSIMGTFIYDSVASGNTFSDPAGLTITKATLVVGSNYNSSSGNVLNVYSNGHDGALFVNASGNVGIGTTAPGAKLEVVGDLRLGGNTNTRGLNVLENYMSLGETESAASTILGNNIKVTDGVNSTLQVSQSASDGSNWIRMNYSGGFSFHHLAAAGVGTTTPETSGELLKITTGGTLEMNGNDISEIDTLFFNSGDSNMYLDYVSTNYLDFRYSATASGGIRMYDGDNQLQGYLYANGAQTFGLLDGDGAWAIAIAKDSNIGFYVNGTELMNLGSTGNLQIDGDFTVSGGDIFAAANTDLKINDYDTNADSAMDVCLFGDCTTGQANAYYSKLKLFGGGGQTRDLQMWQQYSEYAHIGSSWTSNELNIDSSFSKFKVNSAVAYFAGNVGIGTTSPTALLSLNQGAADTAILNLKSSDVAHSLTSLTDADAYGYFQKFDASYGGLKLSGISENAVTSGLWLEGVIGVADPTDTTAAVVLRGRKYNGGTSATYLGDSETLLNIMNDDAVRVTVLGNGNVGIGTTAPGYKLDVQGGYVNASSGLCINGSCQTTWNNIVMPTGTNGQTLYSNAGTWTASSNLYHNGTNVGIGTTNPLQKLHIKDGTSGTFLGISEDTVDWSMGMDNGSSLLDIKYEGTDFATFNSNGQVWLGMQGNVGIGTTNPTEKLHIGSGQVLTDSATNISYAAGDNLIYSDDPEYSVQDDATDANYKLMKTFKTSKSGTLRVKWQGYIQAGTYYWAYKIAKNNGATTLSSGAYTTCDDGVCGVHSYEQFTDDVSGVDAGDTIELWMVSSDSGGTPVNGNGQYLYAKEFKMYSGSPSVEWAANNIWGANVGIGTTAPGAKLVVNGGDLYMNTDYAAGNRWFRIYGNATNYIDLISGVGEQYLRSHGGALKINDDTNNNVLMVTGGGNVGIGVTSPNQKLHIHGGDIQNTNATTGLNSTDGFLFGLDGYDSSLGVSFWNFENAGMRFATNNLARITILSGGNVGIGTTSPSSQTEIQRIETVVRTTYNDILTISANATTNPYTGHGGGILLKGTTYQSGSGNVNYARIGSTINSDSTHTYGSNLFFDVAPLSDGVLSRAMTINYNGNIGMGTAIPDFKLDVAGDMGIDSYIYHNDDAGVSYMGFSANDVIRLGTAGTDRLEIQADGDIILENGNVGIGTTSPRVALDVSSGVDASGAKVLIHSQELNIIDRYSSTDYSARIWASWPTVGNLFFGVNQASGDPSTVVPTLSIVNSSGAGTAGNVGIGTTNPNSYRLYVASGNTYLNGTVTSSNTITGTRLISTIATGTSPLSVTSTTVNTNLNADLLDGYHGSSHMRYLGWVTSPGYDANTIPENQSGFSYANNAPNVGPLVHIAAGGYGMQFSSQYNSSGTGLSFRSRNGDTSTWNSWYTIWHSGNDGTTSTLDADLLDGYHYNNLPYLGSASGTANYVAKFTGANSIGISTIFDNGNVGIGTTAPTYGILSVEGGSHLPGETTLASSFAISPGSSGYSLAMDAIGGANPYAWIQYRAETSAGGVPLSLNPNGGNVGIGTTSPLTKLDVQNGWITVDNTYGIAFGSGGATPDDYLALRDVGAGAGNALLNLVQDSASKLFVEGTSGNVGIGTTAPNRRLQIHGNGSTNAPILITNPTTGSAYNDGVHFGQTTATAIDAEIWNWENGYLRFGTNNAEQMRITTGGYVGIGTTAPDAPLHAKGGAAMTSGWNRTSTLEATYPSLVFNSNSTRWAGILYDHSSNMVFRVGATSNDVMGSGTSALTLNATTGAATFASSLTISGTLDPNGAVTLPTTGISGAGSGSGLDADLLDGYHYNNLPYLGSASGTANYVAKFTGANSIGISTIFDNGNVGIGTTAPSAKLDVFGGVAAGLNDVMWLSGGAAAYESGPRMVFHDRFGTDTYPTWRLGEIGAVYSNLSGKTYGGSLVFNVNDGDTVTDIVEAMRILGNGNVGIGTTGPGQLLHVYKSNADAYQVIGSGATGNAGLILDAANGDALGGDYYWLRHNRATNTFNLDYGSTVGLTIKTDGNVGIGTTNPGSYKLNVNGSLIATDYYSGDGTQGASTTVTGLVFKDGLYTSGSLSDVYLLNTGDTGTGAYTFSGGIFSINASSNYATNINTGTSTGAVTIGGGSGDVSINSNDWDITSAGVGTGFTSWTVDSVIIDGTTIGHTSDTDLLSLASGTLTVNGNLSATGKISGNGAGLREADTNILDSSTWVPGTTGSQTGFSANGSAAENAITVSTGPYGEDVPLWVGGNDVGSDADGGWGSSSFTVDPLKGYRYTVWVKKTGSSDGTTYLGCSTVKTLAGVQDTNPYFWSGDLPVLDKWYLIVAYIHPYDTARSTSIGGIYDPTTGQKVVSITDFKHDTSTSTSQIHRTYLYYDVTITDRQYMYAPRVDALDGKEPSLDTLLNTAPIYAGGTTNYISKFTSANTLGNSVIYDNGTNVGIGTTAPNGLLQVYANVGRYMSVATTIPALSVKINDNSSYSSFILENTQAGANYGSTMLFNLGYGGGATAAGTTVAGGKISLNAEQTWTSTASTQDSYLAFSTALDGTVAEKVRISSIGNVGIGTTNPQNKLVVAGGDASVGYSGEGSDRQLLIYGSGSSGSANQYIKTVGSDSVWHSGYGKFTVEPAGDFVFKPWNSSDGAYIERMRIDTDTGALVVGRNYTTASGPTSGLLVEGNVGIGTTNPGSYKLNVNGSLIATDYYSGDGSQGTSPAAFNGLTFKDGLLTAGTSITGLDNYSSWTAQDGDTTTYTITSGDTLQIASGTALTSNFTGDDVLSIGVTADAITDTQLAYNTGQHLTTASTPTFAALTIDNIYLNGTTIGHTSDTDLLSLASGALTLNGSATATSYIQATNFRDGTGAYNVNLGSGGSEGRGLVAGYSGGSYGGIGYNVRHTVTGGQWVAPAADTSSYLLFNGGGFTFNGEAAGTAGRTLAYTNLATLTLAGNFYASGGISTYDTTVTDNYVEAGGFCMGNGTNCITSWTNVGGSVNGSGTANYIPRWSDADTLTNSIMYDNGTNVGIGTTDPDSKLSVYRAPSNTVGDLSLGLAYSPNGGGSDLWGFRLAATTYDFNIDRSYSGWQATPALTIQRSSGNVGIGTTSPGQKLTVLFDSNNVDIIRATTAAHSIGLGVDSAATYWGASIFQDGVKRFTIESNYGILVGQNYQGYNAPVNGAAFEGNVGIGTTSPNTALMVFGSNGVASKVESSGTGIAAFSIRNANPQTWNFEIGRSAATDFGIYDVSNTNQVLTIKAVSGNVGIGTTNPGNYKLNVVGNTYLNGNTATVTGALTIGLADAGFNRIYRNSNNGTGGDLTISAGNSTAIVGNGGNLYLDGGFGSDSTTLNGNVFIAAGWTLPSSGKVGIGTTNPGSYKLNVNGNSYFSGTTTATGLITGNAGLTVIGSGTWTLSGGQIIDVNNTMSTDVNNYGVVDIGMTNTSATHVNYQALMALRLESGSTQDIDAGIRILEQSASNKISRGIDFSGTFDYLLYSSTFNVNGSGQITAATSGTINSVNISAGAVSGVTTLSMSNQLTNSYANTAALNLTGNGAGITFTGTGPNRITTAAGVNLALMPGTNGKVGVGTTSPNYKLVVSDAGATGLEIDPSGVIYPGGVGILAYDRVALAYKDISFYAGSMANTLTFKSTGNVGIGTTSPGSSLQIHKSTGSEVAISNSASGDAKLFIGYDSTGAGGTRQGLEIYRTYGSSAITLQNNQSGYLLLNPTGGNVGIGTTAPGYKLDVNGAIGVNGVVERQAAGTGYLSGKYATAETASTTGAIYTIGGGYYPTSASLNNMYGVGYAYTDQGQMPANASSWGFYVAGAGVARVWLGSDSGNMVAIGTAYLGKIMTTGNNVASGADPSAADMVIGSTVGTRHDSSIMFWSATSAVRQLATGNAMQYSIWSAPSTPAAQIGTAGTNSYFNAVGGGNVGIGTTAPEGLLDVSSPSGHTYVYVQGYEGYSAYLNLYADEGDDANDRWQIASYASDNTFNLRLDGSPKLTVNTSGYVGIGTTNPTSQLNVYGVGQATTTIADAGSMGGTLWLSDSGQAVNSGGAILFGGNGGTQHFFAGIKGLLQDGSSYSKGDLAFSTRNSTGDSALTERMRITGNGNVGIGTTNPTAILQVNTATAANQVLLSLSNVSSAYGFDFVRSMTTGALSIQGQQVGNNNIVLAPTSGNVGIGTVTPQAKLNILAAQSLTINDLMFTYDANSNYRNGIANIFDSGTKRNNRMSFLVSDQTTTGQTSVMTLNGDGNVGIGTTNPIALLHTSLSSSGLVPMLYSNALWPQFPRTIQNVAASITTNDTTVATGPVIGLNLENSSQTDGTFSPLIAFSRKSASGGYNTNFAYIGGLATGNGPDTNWMAGDLTFGTADNSVYGPVEKMRIKGNGNVGIGTTNPGTKLAVIQAAAGDAVTFGGAGAGYLGFDGSGAWLSATLSSPQWGIYVRNSNYTGNVGIGTTAPGARFNVVAGTNGDYAMEVFNDGNNDTYYGMQVQAGQDSGVGTLIQFRDGDGTDVGEITFSGTTATYGTSSDERMKKNIVDTSRGLDDLLRIKIRDFQFKDNNDPNVYTGYIAQELAQIYPEAVFAPTDGRMWSVDYGKITPLIVKSVQEQQLLINSQESTLASQQETIAGVNLKTTQNVETVAHLQVSVDQNLAVIGSKLDAHSQSLALGEESSRTLGAEVVELKTRLTAAEQKLTDQENNLAVFEAATNDTLSTMLETENMLTERVLNHEERIASLEAKLATATVSADGGEITLPAVPSANTIAVDADGNAALAGIFQAKEVRAEKVETKTATVTNLDSEKTTSNETESELYSVKIGEVETATLGEAKIAEVKVDENADGLDDLTGADGKGIMIETAVVKEDSQIFVTAKTAIDQPLYVAEIIPGQGFKVQKNSPTNQDIDFSWWIVDKK